MNEIEIKKLVKGQLIPLKKSQYFAYLEEKKLKAEFKTVENEIIESMNDLDITQIEEAGVVIEYKNSFITTVSKARVIKEIGISAAEKLFPELFEPKKNYYFNYRKILLDVKEENGSENNNAAEITDNNNGEKNGSID